MILFPTWFLQYSPFQFHFLNIFHAKTQFKIFLDPPKPSTQLKELKESQGARLLRSNLRHATVATVATTTVVSFVSALCRAGAGGGRSGEGGGGSGTIRARCNMMPRLMMLPSADRQWQIR